jgi:hypothetical protein
VDRKKRLGFGALVCVALQCSRCTTGLVLCALEFCTRIGFFHACINLEAANLGHFGDDGTEAEKRRTKFHSCLQCLIIIVVVVVVVIVVVPARLWVFCLQVLTTKERIGVKFMMITSVADLADGEVAAIATTTPTVFVPGVVVSMPKNLEQNLPRRSAAAGGDLSSLDDSAAVENVLSCWTEVCEQCWLSGPTILMLLLQYFTGLTVVTFVGRLGASYLAAMSMANSFVAIIGFDVLVRTWFPTEDRQREERNCRKKFKRFFLNLCFIFFCRQDCQAD